jgi:3-methyladenine DNA glycosylase/8-oxoguanine DNA glycosylase
MPSRSRSRRIRLDSPIDLVTTLGPMVTGRGDPTWRLTGEEAWRTERNVDGPATLHVCLLDGSVEARAWGPGAGRALGTLPRLLGELDDRASFVSDHDPLVHRMHRLHRGMRFAASGTVTATAIATVLGQRVTTGESVRSWRGLVQRWGEPAPGPGERLGLRVTPAPRDLRRLSYADFHPLGVERGRAETIRSLCSHAGRLDALAESPGPDAWAEAARVLPLVRGVGPWTESIIRGTALGDPDAVVVGDLHIPHQICHAFEGVARGSDERMLELLEPFAGHRGRVQRLMLRAPGRPPRYAPRYRPLPIARM